MFNFDGEYRRQPQQNFAGSSKKQNRNELLQKAQAERQQRHADRIFHQSVIKIQASFRGWSVRKTCHDIFRKMFDELKAKHKKTDTVDSNDLLYLMKYFLYFFHSKLDVTRLNYMNQILVAKRNELMTLIATDEAWRHRIKKFSNICLSWGANDPSISSGTIRVLELFLSPSQYENKALLQSILHYLIKEGYFYKIRVLIDSKIPPLIQESIHPPTTLSQVLLNFLKYPLDFCASSDLSNSKFKYDTLSSISEEIFIPAFSEQIQYFVLPTLSDPSCSFPFLQLLETLNTIDNFSPPKTPWLLCSILKLSQHHLGFNDLKCVALYLKILRILFTGMYPHIMQSSTGGEESDDSDTETESQDLINLHEPYLSAVKISLEIINSPSHVHNIIRYIETYPELPVLSDICQLCNCLLRSCKLAVHKYRLLCTLSFRPKFLNVLWTYITSVSQKSLFSRGTLLIQVLTRGIQMTPYDKQLIVPHLAVFCALFSPLLTTLHDTEIFDGKPKEGLGCNLMPFSIDQLVSMCYTLKEICLGLVELAYPDCRAVTGGYIQAVASITPGENCISDNDDKLDWIYLFRVSVRLLRLLHVRDSRRKFCPDGLWLSERVSLPIDRLLPVLALRHLNVRPFHSISFQQATAHSVNEDSTQKLPPLSTQEIRLLTILRELPFVMAFSQRVLILHHLIQGDKMQYQGEMWSLIHHINITIRRDYIYEDAFEKLSPENEPNIKTTIRVHLLNAAGLDEAGIDGGGIFREFLTELIKTSFDPNRGFFCLTKDNTLYPNPSVELLVPNFQKHYYFIGRMLGKVIFENLLVELPLAGFFLSKLVGRGDFVDIHHLDTLDPIVYKNLLYLLNYEGDVSELGLDFTIVQNDLGETKVAELKPGGSNIPLTASNRIEYIHCVADYRLNQQIRKQCHAFKQGLADVVSPEWLAMFDSKELQTLISGASIPIDIQDLKNHCDYSGGYHREHPVIILFWNVVSSMNEDEKSQLLKFVTSCSRPPLLGFKELYPPFCIHHGGTEDRLPTASTCMNLLKLPEFHNEKQLKDRLLYAINAGAGFELS